MEVHPRSHLDDCLPPSPSTRAKTVPSRRAAAGSKTTTTTSPTHQRRCRSCLRQTQSFVVAYFLPLGFLSAAVWAMLWPAPGKAVASIKVNHMRLVETLNNAVFFLTSGLMLRTSDFRSVVRQWMAIVYGLVMILLVTPLLAIPAQRLPLQPVQFRAGLAIFFIVPTTLGVGIALTQVARGNQAIALLLSVATKLLGVVTVPFMLHDLLGHGHSGMGEVDPQSMLVKLMMTVFAPTVLGMLIRASSDRVRDWVTRHRTAMSIFSSSNLIMLIWQTLSGARKKVLQQRPADLLMVLAAVAVMHVVCLIFNWLVAVWVLRLPAPDAVPTILMSSQKSAPVAVTVISYITPSLSEQGLLAIPCVTGQLLQVLLDSFLAHRMRLWVDRYEEEQASLLISSAVDGGEGASDVCLYEEARDLEVEVGEENL